MTVRFIPYAVAEIVGMSDSGVKFCCTVRLTMHSGMLYQIQTAKMTAVTIMGLCPFKCKEWFVEITK